MSVDWQAIDQSLFDPGWYTDPAFHDTFRLMRDEDPVRWVDTPSYAHPLWAVTRYDDVKWCIENPQVLSNREGTRIPRVPKRMTPETRHRMGFDANVVYLDEPLHGIYRRPMNKHFSVPAVKRLGPEIVTYVNRIIDGFEGVEEINFFEAVAGELPVMVIGSLLGIPQEDWAELRLAASRTIESHDPKYTIDGDPLRTHQTGYAALNAYAEQLAEKRRADPQDDFATVIAHMKVDGGDMSLHEVRSWITALILGGFDTTRQALGVGVWQLLQHPDQLRAVVEDPKAVMGAVDETIRYANPGRGLMRVANEDFELNGKRIRAGDWVAQFLISANRDERQFPNPLAWDITRTPNNHLSFGEGVHKCLGRNMVRLELATFYPLFFRRLPELEIAAEPQWIRDTAASGLIELRLKLGKVAAA